MAEGTLETSRSVALPGELCQYIDEAAPQFQRWYAISAPHVWNAVDGGHCRGLKASVPQLLKKTISSITLASQFVIGRQISLTNNVLF